MNRSLHFTAPTHGSHTRRTSSDEADTVINNSNSKLPLECVHTENSMSDMIVEATNEQQSTPSRPISSQTHRFHNNNRSSNTRMGSATQNSSRRTERAGAAHSRPPRVPVPSSTNVMALRESIGVVPHPSPIIQSRSQTPPPLQRPPKSYVPTSNNESSSQRRPRVRDVHESNNNNNNDMNNNNNNNSNNNTPLRSATPLALPSQQLTQQAQGEEDRE